MVVDLASIWPLLAAAPIGALGSIIAFAWNARVKANAEQRERRNQRDIQLRSDFDSLRDAHKAEILRLRDRVLELERQSEREKQLLESSRLVNADMTREIVTLRAEVAVLRAQLEGVTGKSPGGNYQFKAAP